jgi:hypothetical protein
MAGLVPNRFLFRFELSILRWKGEVRIDGDLEKWPSRYELPPLHLLDEQRGFGSVYLAWCDDGLLVACRVEGKRGTPYCDPVRFRQSDHLRVMTDMRDSRDARRATRFCQQFYLMPAGGGFGGREPLAGAAHVARATHDAPLPPPGSIAIAARTFPGGYTLEAHLPARVLAGFDPHEHPRIGFFYILEDRELGQQSLTIGDDLNWWCDPSTWTTAVLTD